MDAGHEATASYPITTKSVSSSSPTNTHRSMQWSHQALPCWPSLLPLWLIPEMGLLPTPSSQRKRIPRHTCLQPWWPHKPQHQRRQRSSGHHCSNPNNVAFQDPLAVAEHWASAGLARLTRFHAEEELVDDDVQFQLIWPAAGRCKSTKRAVGRTTTTSLPAFTN